MIPRRATVTDFVLSRPGDEALWIGSLSVTLARHAHTGGGLPAKLSGPWLRQHGGRASCPAFRNSRELAKESELVGSQRLGPRLKFLVRVLELKEGIAWRHLKLD